MLLYHKNSIFSKDMRYWASNLRSSRLKAGLNAESLKFFRSLKAPDCKHQIGHILHSAPGEKVPVRFHQGAHLKIMIDKVTKKHQAG